MKIKNKILAFNEIKNKILARRNNLNAGFKKITRRGIFGRKVLYR
jgi:hypothetical protein